MGMKSLRYDHMLWCSTLLKVYDLPMIRGNEDNRVREKEEV